MTNPHDLIKAESYMSPPDIHHHLENVEFIVLAAPSTRDDARGPIHFTLFLNTTDALPDDIQQAILAKFSAEQGITGIADLFSQVDDVAFARTAHDAPMPMHLFKPDDKKALPHVKMFVMDFEADSDRFPEVKNRQLTGWTYAYEDDATA